MTRTQNGVIAMAYHSRRWLATVGLAMVCATFSLTAGEGEHPAELFDLLTRKLGSTEFSEREAAERELDAAGVKALPALREATQSDDAEICRRAECLIEQIEKRIETERILQPRRVRLNYQEMPLGEAIEDFSKQTGILVQLAGDPGNQGRVRVDLLNRRINLDTGEVGIWEAFEQLCRSAGLVEQHLTAPKAIAKVTPAGDEKAKLLRANRPVAVDLGQANAAPQSKVMLVEGEAPTLPSCTAGPVRVRALPSRLVPVLSSGDLCEFTLEATADANYNWLHFGNLRIDSAIDENGQALLPQYNFPAPSTSGIAEAAVVWIDGAKPTHDAIVAPYHMLTGRLERGAHPSVKLRELSGTIAAQVQTPPEPLLSMENILAAAGKTVRNSDGYIMEIRDVSYGDNGELSVRVAVQQPLNGSNLNVGRGNRGFRGRMVSNTSGSGGPTNPTVIDAEGKSLSVVRHQSSITHLGEMLSQETTLVYRVSKSRAESARLVFSGPRTVAIQVPFVLKDVMLK